MLFSSVKLAAIQDVLRRRSVKLAKEYCALSVKINQREK